MNGKLEIQQQTNNLWLVDVNDDAWHLTHGEDVYFSITRTAYSTLEVRKHDRTSTLEGMFDIMGEAIEHIRNLVGTPNKPALNQAIVVTQDLNTANWVAFVFDADGGHTHLTKQYGTQMGAFHAGLCLWVGIDEDGRSS